jgi:GTP-binding protein HflX
LLEAVEADLPKPGVEFSALLPYERGDLVDRLHKEAEIGSLEHTADGTLVTGRAHEDLAAALAPYGS